MMFSSQKVEGSRVDRNLVARCRRGEPSAQEELYRTYSGRLYNVAYRFAGNATDADDLLQDTFLQAYRRLDTFRGEASLGTWLYRLAVNCCLDHVRSKQGRQQHATGFLEDLDLPEPAAPASWSPGAALDRIDLERAVAKLPPSYRAAFVLHDVEGLDHREVGTMLGIAEGTSKSLVHKARLRLRALLRGQAGGTPAQRPAAAVISLAEARGER
ncbi:MAG: RNA polymerase sigma factor [Acidobacteriota bacterium]